MLYCVCASNSWWADCADTLRRSTGMKRAPGHDFLFSRWLYYIIFFFIFLSLIDQLLFFMYIHTTMNTAPIYHPLYNPIKHKSSSDPACKRSNHYYSKYKTSINCRLCRSHSCISPLSLLSIALFLSVQTLIEKGRLKRMCFSAANYDGKWAVWYINITIYIPVTTCTIVHVEIYTNSRPPTSW